VFRHPNGAAATSRNHPAPTPLKKNRQRAAEPAEIIGPRQNFLGALKLSNAIFIQ